MPLHGQRRHIEARALQSVNVISQLPPAHLKRLPHLAVEVTGRLREFRQRGHRRQVLVADNRAIGEIPHPTPFENPDLLRFRPSRARGKDAPAHLKRHRIDFQHSEPAKKVLRRVEQVVIINLRAFPKDPALRVGICLRRTALNQVMKGVLALVRVGQIRIVKPDHS